MDITIKPDKYLHGFFSCCSIKLYHILVFFNKNKKLPDNIIWNDMFKIYKTNNKDDIVNRYFKENKKKNEIIIYTKPIDFYIYGYTNNIQFKDYSKINFNLINPFIKKYFSPSTEILHIHNKLVNKYNIKFSNTCVLFYRGNDKNREMKICCYEEFIKKAKKILNFYPDTMFFLQSDETEFITTLSKTFPNNSFYLKEEIRHIKKCNNTVDVILNNNKDFYSKNFLAIILIISKCRHIVFGSGNCSLWIVLYRGNCINVYQNLNSKWIY